MLKIPSDNRDTPQGQVALDDVDGEHGYAKRIECQTNYLTKSVGGEV